MSVQGAIGILACCVPESQHGPEAQQFATVSFLQLLAPVGSRLLATHFALLHVGALGQSASTLQQPGIAVFLQVSLAHKSTVQPFLSSHCVSVTHCGT